MRSIGIALALLVIVIAVVLSVGTWRTGAVAAAAHVVAAAHEDHEDEVAIRDDCDPTDPGWRATSGCALEEGDVNVAEFRTEQSSTRSLSVIGHPAWRNDPSYLKIEADEAVTVTNKGGRTHTFTEVANFGGGKVPNPDLNKGLTTAPECPTSTDLSPGTSVKVTGLSVGNHRFQCCIHPWMRALIKVKPQH